MFLLITAELTARFYLGLGDVPVYIEDKHFEYIYAPNQDVKRFGNSILTNEFSMRSKPLTNKDEIRILKIGDSIINGGSQTDQDSLASSILEEELSQKFEFNVRVLNVGANSWGPDNAFEYIRKFGHFNSSMLVLVFSSHDYYDHMHFQKVVGIHPAWPKEKPFLALCDGFSKYFLPWIKNKVLSNHNEYSYLSAEHNKDYINPGWAYFFNYVEQQQLDLLVYLHPTKQEVINESYDINGLKLIELFSQNKIDFINGLEHNNDVSFYRDFIHLNNKGQKRLAQVLYTPMHVHVNANLQGK